VLDLIYANAVRALPGTHEIQHGPEQSRSVVFDEAIAEAANLGATTVQSASMTADLKIGGIALDIYKRCPETRHLGAAVNATRTLKTD
jgi:hypothetical protein